MTPTSFVVRRASLIFDPVGDAPVSPLDPVARRRSLIRRVFLARAIELRQETARREVALQILRAMHEDPGEDPRDP